MSGPAGCQIAYLELGRGHRGPAWQSLWDSFRQLTERPLFSLIQSSNRRWPAHFLASPESARGVMVVASFETDGRRRIADKCRQRVARRAWSSNDATTGRDQILDKCNRIC